MRDRPARTGWDFPLPDLTRRGFFATLAGLIAAPLRAFGADDVVFEFVTTHDYLTDSDTWFLHGSPTVVLTEADLAQEFANIARDPLAMLTPMGGHWDHA